MTDLFEKNMAFLKDHSPHYYEWFSNFTDISATPIFEDGSRPNEDIPLKEACRHQKIVNLDIGERLLYPEGDAIETAKVNLEKYIKKPHRINIGLSKNAHSTLRSTRASNHIQEAAKHYFKDAYKRSGFHSEVVVDLGIGLGYHIKPMIEALDIRILFITETFREFFYFSLFCVDWEEINDILIAKNGRLDIMCHQYEKIEAAISSRIRDYAASQVDGLLIFMHYPASSSFKLRKFLYGNLAYMASNVGFFEDEIVMLVNSMQNFESSPSSYFWYRKPRMEKNTPVLVVGSAPSVDAEIENIKAVADKTIIISCGTALRVLLKNGIKPDFQMILENTLAQKKVVDDLNTEFDISDITAVASASVYYESLRPFKHKVFFFRDCLSTEKLLEPMCPTINHAGPLVSNLGLRFAIGMGFKNIFMVGIDLGTRDKSTHHSKDSAYFTIAGWDNSISFSKKSAEDMKKDYRPANLGGFVISSSFYDIALLFKVGLAESHLSHNFYNCSDGVRMKGFTPILLSVAAQDFRPCKLDNKTGFKEEVADCFKEMDYIEDASRSYALNFLQIKRRIKRFNNQLIKDIQEMEDFPSLIAHCQRKLLNDGDANDLAAYKRMIKGTIFIELGAAYYYYLRVDQKHFPPFLDWLKALLAFELEEMLDITQIILQKCHEKTTSTLAADAYDPKGFLHEIVTLKPLEIKTINC